MMENKILSDTFKEEIQFKEIKSREELEREITEKNIEVLKTILDNEPIFHCWCDQEGRRDVLIYVSNKYMWIIELLDEELVITKIAVDIFYIPDVSRKREFTFSKETEEYRVVKEYVEKIHPYILL